MIRMFWTVTKYRFTGFDMPPEDYFAGITAFTGHRDYGDPALLYRRLDRLNSRSYMFGGARGIDSDALKYISQTQPGSQRIVVVPNTVQAQPQEARYAIKNYSTKVIELKNTGTNRYFIRNRYMVNNSNRLEAFYDMRKRGGTYQTINYANSKGGIVNVNYLTGTDFQQVLDLPKDQFMETMESLRKQNVNVYQLKGITIQYFRGKGLGVPRDVVQRFRLWESE